MKNKIILIIVILIGFTTNILPQLTFRNAVLLTHSSGSRLYDYDGLLGN